MTLTWEPAALPCSSRSWSSSSPPLFLRRGAEPPAAGSRETVDLSTGWRFQIDAHDQGERERWFDHGRDRTAWRTVEVPRAWDTYDESLRGFEGIGWYAVTLDASLARPEKPQRLTFGRVMYHTKAWLNGEYLGEHVDGYLPFSFDVTGKLDAPGERARASRGQPAPDRLAARRPSRSSGSSTGVSCNRSGSRAGARSPSRTGHPGGPRGARARRSPARSMSRLARTAGTSC